MVFGQVVKIMGSLYLRLRIQILVQIRIFFKA